jgi:hypothetical protein
MQRVLGFLVSVSLGLGFLVPAASAGYKESNPVQVIVDLVAGTGMAYGSLGSTRSGGNAASYLGCSVSADAAGGVTGACQASNGILSGSCILDPLNFEYHLMSLRNMTPSSAIVFAWVTQNGQRICTYFNVVEASYHPPVQP